MNIDWVIPCRYVEVHDNLGTIVGAGIDTFWVPELPAGLQVLLAVRLLAMADEYGEDQEHTATNRIKDPHGDVMTEVTGTFTVGSESDPREDWLTGIMLNSVVQFEAPEAGTYTIEQEVDGNSKLVPIHVVHGPPPGAQPPPQ